MRRVPEAALLAGAALAATFAVFGFLFAPDPLSVVAVALATFYGSAVWAVAADDDPASTLVPDYAFAAGTVVGALALAYGAVVGRPLFGLFVALVAVVPPALYHARYADSVNPVTPEVTLTIAVLAGLLVLAYGQWAGDPLLGAVDAALLVLAAADYRDQRGDPLAETAERVAVAVCLGGAVLFLFAGLFVFGTPTSAVVVAFALLVVGAYFAMPGAAERAA